MALITASRSMDPVWSASRRFFIEIDRWAGISPPARALQEKAEAHREGVWQLLEDYCFKDCTYKWQEHIAAFFDTLLEDLKRRKPKAAMKLLARPLLLVQESRADTTPRLHCCQDEKINQALPNILQESHLHWNLKQVCSWPLCADTGHSVDFWLFQVKESRDKVSTARAKQLFCAACLFRAKLQSSSPPVQRCAPCAGRPSSFKPRRGLPGASGQSSRPASGSHGRGWIATLSQPACVPLPKS